MQAPRCPSHPSCAGERTPQNIVSLACGALNPSEGQALLVGAKSLLGTQFSWGDNPCLRGSSPFLWSTLAHVAQVPFRGPNSLGGSPLACRAQTPFLGIKSLWVQNPLWGTGLAAMHPGGRSKPLLESKLCLCVPNPSQDQNPFWGSSLACGAQNLCGTQIPFRHQAFCVGAKSPWCPETLLRAKPCFWIPTTLWGQNSF